MLLFVDINKNYVSGKFQMRYKPARLSKCLLQPIFADIAFALLGIPAALCLSAHDHLHGFRAV